jgi:asparagine synthase (glutamine-hydrolysing)
VRAARTDFVPQRLRSMVAGTLATVPRIKGRHLLGQIASDPLERHATSLQLFTPDEVGAVVGPSVREHIGRHDTRWHLRRHWRSDLDPVTRLQYLDLKTYLPDDILTKVDRASMAVGLEVRPPLLDHRIVERVVSLPPAVRVPGREPKGLMKRTMQGRLPPEIIGRDKKGFSAPWNAWMQDLEPWASGELRDGSAVQRGILGPDPVAVLGPDRRGAHLWSLLALEWWCRAHP